MSLAAVGGLTALRGPEPRSVLMLVVGNLLVVSAVQALFYVEGRHRFAVEPLVLVLSADGMAELARFVRGAVHAHWQFRPRVSVLPTLPVGRSSK